ncbi:MAG: hypothetical protein ACE5GS_13665 [Kiloniellaceae bacterium]
MSFRGHLCPIVFAVLLSLATVGAAPAGTQEPAATDPADEAFEGLPAGPGREQVFYTCRACHSLALVKQQGLSRDFWDETLVWMVDEQEMEPPEPEDRKLILDYLSKYYGPDRKRR